MEIRETDWPELSRLMDRMLEFSAEEREAFVASLALDHPLRAPLLELLRRGGARTGFLERMPAIDLSALAPGDPVGPYRLERPLGRGGMGVVWLAERADAVPARKVALKLARWVGDPEGLLRRMERERDALAALDHPNIARLYDAGLDDRGRPWLAMEYIDGEPLDRYAARGLGVRAKVTLFLQVADAVSSAHARLVVHRDLKPANILVTADGVVKLLDFGVAKILHPDASGPSLTTELAGAAFTPDYAAPEQLEHRPVTVATDVYALGVVLHELLAGVRPYQLSREHPGGLAGSLHEVNAPPPSSMAPPSERGTLRGDLDLIVARAMRRDPGERYGTVNELAADLRRYLAGEPILARPDSTWYRARKFVGRHRLASGLGAALLLSLTTGFGAVAWEARAEKAARDRAEALLARSAAVGEAMDHLLDQAAAELEPAAFERLVHGTAEQARRALAAAPEQEATVLLALARYLSDGEHDRTKSLALVERAVSLAAGSADRDLQAQAGCARATWSLDTPDAANARDLARRLGRDPALGARTRVECLSAAVVLSLHLEPAEAKALAGEVEAASAQVQAVSPRLRAQLLWGEGQAAYYTGDLPTARARYGAALAVLEGAGLARTAVASGVQFALSELDQDEGALPAALGHIDAILEALGSRPPPDVLLSNRAFLLDGVGRFEEALVWHGRAVERARAGGNAWAVVDALAGKGITLWRLGRLDEALRELEGAEKLIGSAVGENAPSTNLARYALGSVLVDLGKVERARRYAELLFPKPGAGRAAGQNAYKLRAKVELAAGELDAAERDAAKVLELAVARRREGRPSLHVARAQLLVARVAERAHRPEVALTNYREARDQLAATAGEGSADTREAADGVRRLGAGR